MVVMFSQINHGGSKKNLKKRSSFIIFFGFVGILIIFAIVNFAYEKITSRSLLTRPELVQHTENISSQAKAENLKLHVTAIASFSPPRNYQNLESLNKSAEYIEKEFAAVCPSVKRQAFTVNDKEYFNIICLFGEEKDLVVVGAHYDVDHEAVGADDNASGIAGLIELARLLKEKPSQQNIELVAFSLEELPYFRTENMGSFQHATYLKKNNITVKYMLSLEMIGYFSQEENSQKIPSRLLKLFYPTTGNFIAIIGRLNKDSFITPLDSYLNQNISLPVRSLHAPDSMLGGHSSDQINYWQMGYEAAMITDTGPYRNKNYHKVTDTPDTLDYESSAKVVSGIYGFLVNE
jgi:hypothetical protein